LAEFTFLCSQGIAQHNFKQFLIFKANLSVAEKQINSQFDICHTFFDHLHACLMNNYYKYLPISAEDERWGLYVLNAGYNCIAPHEVYPATEHPAPHYFNWEDGRVLQEYQLIYITAGTGFFESTHCSGITVCEGSILLLFPGEWHRFRPQPSTGWDEYWIGFAGPIMDQLVGQHFFAMSSPVLEPGLQDTLLQLFITIIDASNHEKPGYQALIAGSVLHLLGALHANLKQKALNIDDALEPIINKAQMLLRAGIDKPISIEQVAQTLQVSYSWFRKAFKSYTGMPPGQYLLQLKIERAKLLLADGSLSVKQVAYALHFESAFYFSTLFKKKMGQSPEQYRKQLSNSGYKRNRQ
jgi:AraC-like DNA-binding protein